VLEFLTHNRAGRGGHEDAVLNRHTGRADERSLSNQGAQRGLIRQREKDLTAFTVREIAGLKLGRGFIEAPDSGLDQLSAEFAVGAGKVEADKPVEGRKLSNLSSSEVNLQHGLAPVPG